MISKTDAARLAMAAVMAVASQGCRLFRPPDIEVTRRPHYVRVVDNRDIPTGGGGWRESRVFEDWGGDGFIDRVTDTFCMSRPGSLGLDKDCTTQETSVLPNGYEGGFGAVRRGGTYAEIGLYSLRGRQLQEEFGNHRDGKSGLSTSYAK